MDRYLIALVLGGATITHTMANAQSGPMGDRHPDMESAVAMGDLSSLPALPRGKSTILGGEIHNVDPVLDQFTLRVFGQRPMKIIFDERTQVFRNGERIHLRDLHSEEHASIQTVLDGSNVFAISIHMLSSTPEGECQGRVLSYDPGSRELQIGSALSRNPVRIFLRDDTAVVREGQGAFRSGTVGQADLAAGALVNVKFDADGKGRATASHIIVLAKPGSDFAFSGKLSSLDMHAGLLVLVDPRDQKSYQISFNPSQFPGSESMHAGDQIRVSASFDGNRYEAQEITPIQTAQP